MKNRIISMLLVMMFTFSFTLTAFPVKVMAASYPILTESTNLSGLVTISNENGEAIATNSNKKYLLTEASVIYSSSAKLQIKLSNLFPVTINQIKCKGEVEFLSGTGTLNVVTKNDVAIDAGYFDIQSGGSSIVNAEGAKYGVKSAYYVEVGQARLNAKGSEYGVYAGSYIIVEKGGEITGDATSVACVYAEKNYIEIRDNSKLTGKNPSAQYGVYAGSYFSILRSSNMDALGKYYGTYAKSYYSVLDGSTLIGEGSNTGVYSTGGYVSVLRNSTVKGTGSNIGVYSKYYHSVLNGSYLYGNGGEFGLKSDEYIHAGAAASVIEGVGGTIGVVATGNGGDSIFATDGAQIIGTGYGQTGRGVVVSGKGHIHAINKASVTGTGNRSGVEANSGYVKVYSGGVITGITTGLNDGYSAVTTNSTYKPYVYANGLLHEIYQDANLEINEIPLIINQKYVALQPNMKSLLNYTWQTSNNSVAIKNNGLVATKSTENVDLIAIRDKYVSTENVYVENKAIHKITFTGVKPTIAPLPTQYTVNYLDSNTNQPLKDQIVKPSLENTVITSASEAAGITITGYVFDSAKTQPSIVLTTSAPNNVLNIYFKKAAFTYTISHQYGSEAPQVTTKSLEYGSNILESQVLKTGYTFDKVTVTAVDGNGTPISHNLVVNANNQVVGTMPNGNVTIEYKYSQLGEIVYLVRYYKDSINGTPFKTYSDIGLIGDEIKVDIAANVPEGYYPNASVSGPTHIGITGNVVNVVYNNPIPKYKYGIEYRTDDGTILAKVPYDPVYEGTVITLTQEQLDAYKPLYDYESGVQMNGPATIVSNNQIIRVVYKQKVSQTIKIKHYGEVSPGSSEYVLLSTTYESAYVGDQLICEEYETYLGYNYILDTSASPDVYIVKSGNNEFSLKYKKVQLKMSDSADIATSDSDVDAAEINNQ